MAAVPQQVDGTTDEGLAQRVARGDDGAFDELYRRYSRPLAAFGGRIVGDRSAGEDVAQTALLKAYQAMRRGQGPVHVRAWLYGIAQNTSYDLIRRRRDVVGAEFEAVHEDASDAGLDREALLRAVRDLPQRQRDVYLLRELNGLSVSEIGERLDLAVEQVEQALFAARNRLAEHLVFGGRLTCTDVRKLDPARLGLTERRALKSHARRCPTCRKAGIGGRPSALGLANFVEGARQLFQALVAGGPALPAAAVKVGAIAATAALAGGGTVVAGELSRHRSHAPAVVPSEHIGPPVFADPSGTAAAFAAVVAPAFLGESAPGSPTSWLLATAPSAPRHGAPAVALGPGPTPEAGGRPTADVASADAAQSDQSAGDTGSTDAGAGDTPPGETSTTDSAPVDTEAVPAEAPPPDVTPPDRAPADSAAGTTGDPVTEDAAPTDTAPVDTAPADPAAEPAP